MQSFRETVELKLLNLPNILPLTERTAHLMERYEDGTFGLSYLGFLLYCNGRNPRGVSSIFPNGLLYADKENLFGIGLFRRELGHDEDKEQGHLMIVAPRGTGAIKAIEQFASDAVAVAPQLHGQLLYVRFLKKEQADILLSHGFQPIQSEPWHPTAFAEDETYNHSVVQLSDLFDKSGELRTEMRRPKSASMRFNNFLKRYNLEWCNGTYSIDAAKEIIQSHFEVLTKQNKQIGSVAEDYFNLLEISKPGNDRFAKVMYLQSRSNNPQMLSSHPPNCVSCRRNIFPCSVFIGEKISSTRMALYCTISRRDQKACGDFFGLNEPLVGFTALSTYAFLKAFEAIRSEFPEIEEVHLGGSETADLDAFKQRLGAREEPTYWVVQRLAARTH